MRYFTDLYTVETYEAFLKSERLISGFRKTQKAMAERVQPGDRLIGYIMGLSRWACILEINSGPFEDDTPLFLPPPDPYVVRFRVSAILALPIEQTVPIKSPEVFGKLSFTRGKGENDYWIGPLRKGLQRIDPEDGAFLESILRRQAEHPSEYPIDKDELQRHRRKSARRADRTE